MVWKHTKGGATHATVTADILTLTDQVMAWFGFTQEYAYPVRPYAMIVACTLYNGFVRPNDGQRRLGYVATLTASLIRDADAETGGRLSAHWQACQGGPQSEPYPTHEPE